MSRFHSDERQVPDYRVGRVFLAGDAAHVHSPAGGQGMNTGLQDAANLGWKLAAVVQGRAPASLLDTYQAERHPVGELVLRMSGGLLRVALSGRRTLPVVRAVARAVLTLPPTARKAAAMLSGIGIGYDRPHRAHRMVGRRAPDLPLVGGSRVYEALRGGGFVLVAPADVVAAAGPVADHVVAASEPGDRRRGMLVRPDGYIAWASDDADPAAVRAALAAAPTVTVRT